MDIKLFFVSMVLCGEVVSLYCANPIQLLCAIAKEGAEVSNVTIKSI